MVGEKGQYDPGYLTIANRLHHYKQLRLKLEAHNTKAESIQLRKKWLEAQKRANYQQEYDRIRGLLSQSILSPGKKRLEEREVELKALGIAGPGIIV